ncbi:type VI secretion system baseplate subunit TssE [Sphingomonas arantia]|uniref:Type VI secretion system baseplate subunit TssE n=1 Tax=Sphingomonas arantia TaxID=1460676 RepID=A0ABW4TZK5_9SPHN
MFDKLVAENGLSGWSDGDAGRAAVIGGRPSRAVPKAARLNEASLRTTLLRELTALLNTTNLHAVQDLSSVPEVMTSTLNYGLGDLSGTLLTRNGVQTRARDMREAITRFEPRIERGTLEVEPAEEASRPNSISFIIRGDVAAAVQAMPVEIRTDVDVDTGAAFFEGQ